MPLIALLLFLIAVPSAQASVCATTSDVSAALPYAAGEELSYRFEFRGMAAGRAHFKLGDLERTPYGVGYPIRADLETNAYVSFVNDMEANFLSLLDPRSRTTRYYRSNFSDKKRGKVVDRAQGDGAKIRFKHSQGKRLKEGKFAGELIDPVSLIYGLRDLKFNSGAKVCLGMYAFSGMNRVRGRVIGLETIKTEAGPVKAWRIRLKLKRGGAIFPLHLWVGEDSTRPLWRAELHHPEGVLSVHLDRHVYGRKQIYRL